MFRDTEQRGKVCQVLTEVIDPELWRNEHGVPRPTDAARSIASGDTGHSSSEVLLVRIAWDMWNTCANAEGAVKIGDECNGKGVEPRKIARMGYARGATYGRTLECFDGQNLRMVGELLVALSGSSEDIDTWIEKWRNR